LSTRFRTNARFRAVLLEGIGLVVAAVLVWWLVRNTTASLERRGISLGFDFLRQPASFEIGETPLHFTPEDSFGRAIVIGLINTAKVSSVGWLLSLGLGFILGVLRLADNPPLRGLVRGWVELTRNTPLLLLLLFLAATLHTLPATGAAFQPLPHLFISDRGVALPYPVLSPLSVGLGVTWLLSLGTWWRLGRVGGALVLICTTALAFSLAASHSRWDLPRLQGFNYVGGLAISPEFAALLAALVLHHSAHISEVVRGAILAVPRGQREAALSVGMSERQAMRLVIMPQALRAMVPLLATNCVSLTKNSSLAVAIGFPDVVSILNTTANQTGHSIETMLIMIAIYLTLSLAVASALNSYNARLLRRGARLT
jgi:general L-amino acid transport system permease protein